MFEEIHICMVLSLLTQIIQFFITKNKERFQKHASAPIQIKYLSEDHTSP